ncbi:hypothetical protein GCM10022221_55080 [Actinocorallia aurea]
MANSRGRELVVAATALLALAVAGCGTDGPEGEAGATPSSGVVDTAPSSGSPGPGGQGPGGGEGETAPPVGPSAQPWQTPQVPVSGGADLKNGSPRDDCTYIVPSEGDVRIVSYEIEVAEEPSALPPESYLAEHGVPAATTVPSLTLTEQVPVNGEVPDDGTCRAAIGEPEEGDPPPPPEEYSTRPCAVDLVLVSDGGCTLWAKAVGGELPGDSAPGEYRIMTHWRLTKLCTSTEPLPCRNVDDIVPTAETPVRVYWNIDHEVRLYVVWLGEASTSAPALLFHSNWNGE